MSAFKVQQASPLDCLFHAELRSKIKNGSSPSDLKLSIAVTDFQQHSIREEDTRFRIMYYFSFIAIAEIPFGGILAHICHHILQFTPPWI